MNKSSKQWGWGVAVAAVALAGLLMAADDGGTNTGTDVKVRMDESSLNVTASHGSSAAQSNLLSGKFVVRRLSKFSNENFYNDKGEKVGKLDDLVIDPQIGTITFGVVSFNSSVGVGSKCFAIPWTAIHKDLDEKNYNRIAYSMPIDKSKLENGRGFERNNWPDLADRTFSRDLYSHWGQRPYWEGALVQSGRISGFPISPDSSRIGMKSGRLAIKGSSLIGHELVDSSDAKLGKLEELLADPQTGQLIYGITKITKSEDLSRNLHPVPWSLLSARDIKEARSGGSTGDSSSNSGSSNSGSSSSDITSGSSSGMNLGSSDSGKTETKSSEFRLVLNATLDQLKTGPQFSDRDWPNMTPAWGEQVYNHYGVRPFWKTGASGSDSSSGGSDSSDSGSMMGGDSSTTTKPASGG